jgi:exosome complex exonuclease RRP6
MAGNPPRDDETDESQFSAVRKSISDALISTTRATARVCAEDIGFHRSLDPSIAAELDRAQKQILSLAERLLANAAAGTSTANPKLPDADAVDGNWRGIVEVVDSLLERADTCLDEYNGLIKKRRDGGETESPVPKAVQASGSKTRGPKVPKNLDIPKPQEKFEIRPNNHFQGAFKPLLKEKPNAKTPLDFSTTSREDLVTSTVVQQYNHPYQSEINQYTAYPTSTYVRAEPIPYAPLEETTAIYVDTLQGVSEMLEELRKSTLIAIDLEHHDQRSYVGIVSLMQISTRDKDWIVDTLQPWRQKLQILNEVFTDPKIVKVLHGSFMDIVWLQRDLGLYIIGLFDTYHACQVLGYEGASLAYLLRRFCDFDAQKQYQLADWRVRPIPSEMLFYAQADTHFLLFIFDNLRNDLLSTRSDSHPESVDPMTEVLTRSKETALKQYEYPSYDEKTGLGSHGWYRPLAKTPALLSKEQFAVFRRAHQWRDHVAREEDESSLFVMSNHALFAVARELPSDRAAVFRVAAPVSQPVRLRVDELVGVINRAIREGKEAKDDMKTVMAASDTIYFAELKRERQLAGKTKEAKSKKKHVEKHDDKMDLDVDAATEAAELVANFKLQDTVATHSQFWGGIATTATEHVIPIRNDISCQIPLPDLTAQVFATSTQPVEVQASPLPAPKFIPKDKRREAATDDVFIVSQLGRNKTNGRKRPHEEVETVTNSDFGSGSANVIAVDDKSDMEVEKKKSKKDKHKKKDRKQQAAEEVEEDEKDDEYEPAPASATVPFDYASVPSLLTAPPVERKRQKMPKVPKEKNPYDMYGKSLDAAKGLARTQKPSGGRSKTFTGK